MKTLLSVIPIERACRPVGCGRTAVLLAARRAASNERDAIIHFAPVVLLLLLTSFGASQTLTGTVTNSTTSKPSPGDEVVVFKVGQGIEESGHTKTDASGQFSFKLDDPQVPHLIRVIHQGVTYHRMAPPGTTSTAIEVYDVASRVEGVKVFADIMRVRAEQGQIVVTREFAVQNTSNPPRTQMNERNLEFYILDRAHVIDDSARATIENGNSLKSALVREVERNRYSFIFPLRPGLTRFEVTYQLPYSGRSNLDPKSIYPLEHFVVMLPKAMRFKAAAGSTRFKLINFPNQPGATVQVASNTRVGQNLAFDISGEGTLETRQHIGTQGSGERNHSSTGGAPSAQSINHPSEGSDPPIDAPDPPQKYRWWILGGYAAVLIIGGTYATSRHRSTTRDFKGQKSGPSSVVAKQQKGDGERDEALILEVARAPNAARPTSKLMEGIKEELFRIEVERKRGQISQSEYQKVKAALGQTLARALKHEAQRI